MKILNKKVNRIANDSSKWTPKRLAWAFGCSPKGSTEESRLLNLLVIRLDELKALRLPEPIDGDSWPFGPPSFHETCCKLHLGAVYCDCKASDASDVEYGRAV